MRRSASCGQSRIGLFLLDERKLLVRSELLTRLDIHCNRLRLGLRLGSSWGELADGHFKCP